MQTFKLVRLIQYHSDRLADSLLHQVRMSERVRSYSNVSSVELKDRVIEIYHHLGSWLLDKSEDEIDRRYNAIGARRGEQDIPLSELVWVVLLTKSTLYKFIEDVSLPGFAEDIEEKQELLQRLDQFFDHAVYATVAGYENAPGASVRPAQTRSKTQTKARQAS